jgi:hypothetical protein
MPPIKPSSQDERGVVMGGREYEDAGVEVKRVDKMKSVVGITTFYCCTYLGLSAILG